MGINLSMRRSVGVWRWDSNREINFAGILFNHTEQEEFALHVVIWGWIKIKWYFLWKNQRWDDAGIWTSSTWHIYIYIYTYIYIYIWGRVGRRIDLNTFHMQNISTIISQMFFSGGCLISWEAHRADNRYLTIIQLENSLVVWTGFWVQVFSLILHNSVALSVGIQSDGDSFQRPKVRIQLVSLRFDSTSLLPYTYTWYILKVRSSSVRPWR